MTTLIKGVFLCIVIAFLPGCGRIIDWTKKSFAQTSTDEINPTIQKHYIRSVSLYDQITTVGKFDALWLSDEIRKLYSQLLAKKFGRTDEQQKASLRRQLEENKHFIVFYVLSLHEYPLGDPTSEWAVFLSINDKNYSPIEIKSVELTPEYIFILGKKYNRFRVPYSIKFDARTIEDEPLITENTKTISLCFRSVNREAIMTWNISPNEMIVIDQKVETIEKKEEEKQQISQVLL